MEKETNRIKPGMSNENIVEIDLLDLFRFFWKKKKTLIVATIIGAVISGLVTHFAIEPKYTATSEMYMVSASSGSVLDLSQLQLGTSLSQDYAKLMMTRSIVEGVADNLSLNYTYDELCDMIDLQLLSDTRIIQINVTSTDPVEAKNIANSMAQQTKKQLPKVMNAPEPNIAEKAITPEEASSPSLIKNVVLAALVVLLLFLAYYTVKFVQDDTVKTGEDVEKYFGVLPLTVIPESQFEGIKKETSRTVTKKKERKHKQTRS